MAPKARRSARQTKLKPRADSEEDEKPAVPVKKQKTDTAKSQMVAVNNKLTAYEREREETMARNAEMLAALGVESAAQEMQAKADAGKPKRQHKGIQSEHVKRRREEVPLVVRRYNRVQGLSADGGAIKHEHRDGTVSLEGRSTTGGSSAEPWREERRIQGPVPMKSSNWDEDSDAAFVERLKEWQDDQPLDHRRAGGSDRKEGSCPDLTTLQLKEGDVGRVVKAGVYICEFLPIADRVLIAAGGKDGAIGIWDADAETDEGGNDGVYPYKPHSRCISGLAFAPHDFTRMYSSSFDGTVRVMDVETASFQETFVCNGGELSSLCMAPETSRETVYAGDVDGAVLVIDGRAGKVVESYQLHHRKVNTLQFNPADENVLVTSGIDTTACVWDVRKLPKGGTEEKPEASDEALATLNHSKASNSAYFSPDGAKLMTTSYDDYVRIWDGKLASAGEVSKPVMISHNNNTGRWISAFRAVWASDSNQAIIGGMKRTLDVLSYDKRGVKGSLSSDYMGSIAARNAVHPLIPGVVAGGSAGGKVFLWRPS